MASKDSSPAASTSSTNSAVEEIKTSLKAHNESFDQLLRYIPAKYYIKEENVPAPVVVLTKAQKKAAKKRSNEAATKAAKSDALRQAKLARYDPDEPKTIPEILAAKALAASQKGKARASNASSDAWSDAEDSGADSDGSAPPGSDDEEDSANDTDFADSDDEEPTMPNGLHHPRENTGPAPSITELRSKLQSRIADIQAHKRGGVVATPGSAAVEGEEEGKTQSKEELLEQRRKQRGLVRDNRRRKRKAERRDEKPKPKDGEKPAPSNGRKGGGKANAPVKEPRNEDEGADEDRPRKKSKATPPAPKALPTPAPTSVVVAPPTAVVPAPAPAPKAPAPESSLSFSTLDFSTTALLAANGAAASLGTKVKKNRHALPKDPNAALEVLAKRKERMEALNPEQRERKEDKDRWEKVGLKAEGEKVRDDEKRLKKMAKRQEKIKSKSAKAWAERKETVSATITAKVAKRNNNMAARAKQVKDKKLGIKTKSKSAVKTVSKSFASRNKGRAGFEGSAGKKGKK